MVRRPYSAQAWKRLGLVVSAARQQHADYEETREWAAAVGRSGRVLLGLERGEPVGKNTLRRIEEVLGWEVGAADAVLDGEASTAEVSAHPTLRALDRDEIVLGPGDALAAIENDPLLADQAKIHLLNQYRLLLFVPPIEPGEMSARADRTTAPSRAVAKHGDPADKEGVHRIAQEVRDAYEEELRRRQGKPNG